MAKSGQPSSPKTYSPSEAPKELLELAARLMPLLLAGESPTSALLREQHARARIRQVTSTGVGFFIEFEVPADMARTVPANLTGGSVDIELEGVEHGAGCVLFVRDGALSILEVYTYGEEWPEHPVVLELRDARSICA